MSLFAHWVRAGRDNLAQLCSLDDAILALMSLAATATHKAAPPANEAIANIADVRDGSVEAGEPPAFSRHQMSDSACLIGPVLWIVLGR